MAKAEFLKKVEKCQKDKLFIIAEEVNYKLIYWEVQSSQ